MTPLATALIAEDEPLLAAHLRAELQRCWPALRVLATCTHGQEAVQQALALRPQVLFLDIHMPGLTGLEAAQELAEDWPADVPFPLLVFVTAYDHYAVQAFGHAAVDYLLKPVQPERLAQCCQRLQDTLAQRQPLGTDHALNTAVTQLRQLLGTELLAAKMRPATPHISVIQAGVGNAIHMVAVDDVVYFEAADKYVRVITPTQEHLIRTSLRELLPQLDPQRFWQVHRGTVVRADAIATAQRDESGKLTLHLRQHPDRLTVSRLYTHLFKAM
jgi:DNA-binding LytR/AlgR family response regulator